MLAAWLFADAPQKLAGPPPMLAPRFGVTPGEGMSLWGDARFASKLPPGWTLLFAWPLVLLSAAKWGEEVVADRVVSMGGRGFGGDASARGGLFADSKVDLATFDGAPLLRLFADTPADGGARAFSKVAEPKATGPKNAKVSRTVVSRVLRWRVGEGCLAPLWRRDPPSPGAPPSDGGFRV